MNQSSGGGGLPPTNPNNVPEYHPAQPDFNHGSSSAGPSSPPYFLMDPGSSNSNNKFFVPTPHPASAVKKSKRGLLAALVLLALSLVILGGGSIFILNNLGSRIQSGGIKNPSTITKVVQGNSSAPDWTVTADLASKSAVSITIANGNSGTLGSGVVLDNQGHIITNNHVVSEHTSNSIIFIQKGDRLYQAKIIGTDPASDLAVLKLANKPKEMIPITFSDSDKVRVGEPVMAIGNPLGLRGTVTTGIVSALNRPVTTTNADQTTFTNAIQTSAAINPGNSGGALVNANGELIGINSSIATLGSSNKQQAGSIGIGFAIESNLVKRVANEIISHGSAKHPSLGITAKSGTSHLGQDTIVGTQVTTVVAGSNAANAGIRVGDLIIQVGNKQVSSPDSLVALIRAEAVGSTVKVTLIRNDHRQVVNVKLKG